LLCFHLFAFELEGHNHILETSLRGDFCEVSVDDLRRFWWDEVVVVVVTVVCCVVVRAFAMRSVVCFYVSISLLFSPLVVAVTGLFVCLTFWRHRPAVTVVDNLRDSSQKT
jgi:hypothetical protein